MLRSMAEENVLFFTYLIFILCNFNLNPSISLRTPDNADNITTLTVVYKYGFALNPDILNGDSNSYIDMWTKWKQKKWRRRGRKFRWCILHMSCLNQD